MVGRSKIVSFFEYAQFLFFSLSLFLFLFLSLFLPLFSLLIWKWGGFFQLKKKEGGVYARVYARSRSRRYVQITWDTLVVAGHVMEACDVIKEQRAHVCQTSPPKIK